MSVLPSPPSDLLTQTEKSLFNFLWNGKPDKIKRDIMKLPTCMGGMLVPDIALKNAALKIAWVQRVLNKECTFNLLIGRTIPISLDLFWYCNMNQDDVYAVTNNISNMFVKHMMQAWFKYRFNNPTNIDQIYNQVIWFNSHIKINSRTVFNKHLYDNNIIYVHQFFDEQGEILNIEQLQQQYHVEINYLGYYGIISAIPQKWKRIIKEFHGMTIVSSNYMYTPFLALKKKYQVCKFVYLDMVDQLYGHITSTGYKKWKAYFPDDLPEETWQQAFTTMHRSISYTKTLAVQFKILHFTLFTRYYLHKWGLVENDICVFCDEDIETLPHILVECEVVKVFWTCIHNWLSEKTEIIYLPNTIEIVLGINNPNPNLAIFNTIFLLAKNYIFVRSRNKECLSFDGFRFYVQQFRQIEKAIAIKNDKIEQYNNTWQKLVN